MLIKQLRQEAHNNRRSGAHARADLLESAAREIGSLRAQRTSLRDQFAIAAMQAILTAAAYKHEHSLSGVPKESYAQADAMLSERSKQS